MNNFEKNRYISIENQDLLWSVVNSFPYFIEKFRQQPHFKKDEWFKYIIEQVYNEIEREDEREKPTLLSMNKRTITLMVDTFIIKPSYHPLSSSNEGINREPIEVVSMDSFGINTGEITPYKLKKSEINFEDNYLQRQKEYNTVLENKPKQEINFREKTEDIPIIQYE
jgi:hypothetical protein